MKSTYIAKEQEIERKCYVIDAQDRILGKVAVKAATILRGKHKPIYTPHVDCGDNVIIINAKKVKTSGKKLQQKVYTRYSGYPSGQKNMRLEEMLTKAPTNVVKLAVNRMIPKGPLGNKIRGRLRVYANDTHPHSAQKPINLDI